VALFTTALGFVSSAWGLVFWPVRRAGQAMGVTNAPYVLLGNPTLVALPDDPRPGYESWWHLECINKQRGKLASRIPTRNAEACRVRISFKPLFDNSPELSDDGVFLIGTSQPPSEVAVLPVDRAMPLPLYLQAPKGMPHPISGQPLKAGSYMTGAQFLFQPALVDRQLLSGGTYEVTVCVKWNRQTFTKQLQVQARAPVAAIALPSQPPTPRKLSEVRSDGIRWRHNLKIAGGWYLNADDPIAEALCPDEPQQAIELMVKTPFGGELKDIREAYNVGQWSGSHGPYRLWCPGLNDHQGHEVTLTESRTWTEAETLATKRLKAQIESDSMRRG
jgi:hypothetical protein